MQRMEDIASLLWCNCRKLLMKRVKHEKTDILTFVKLEKNVSDLLVVR